MADSKIEELKTEDALIKKTRQKKRVRGVLIVVSALLLAYTGYLTVQTIIDRVNEYSSKDVEDTITLLDKSAKDSLTIYSKYFNDDSKVDVSDVSTYGRYLITSKGRNYVDSYKISDEVSILDVVDNNKPITYSKQKNVRSLGSYLDQTLDLYSLSKGTYMLFDKYDDNDLSNNVVYHYSGEKYFEETIYSFKNDEGTRTKITLKGKKSSPALVIEISEVASLPNDYHDIVIYDPSSLEASTSYIESLKQNYDVYVTSSLIEAYQTKASYALSLYEGDGIYTSKYTSIISNSDETITSGPLINLDKDNAIRELGGYIFNAGYGYYSESDKEVSDASLLIKNNILDTHVGKYTIKVGNAYENALDDINKVLKAQ